MNETQREIYRRGGIIEMYKQSGRSVFQQLAKAAKKKLQKDKACGGGCGGGEDSAIDEKQKNAHSAW